jgi:hypothetical protein
MIDSHGPFTFVFKPDRDWYSLFTEVKYGNFAKNGFAINKLTDDEFVRYDFTHKIEDFRDEHEWWAPGPVSFQLEDIQAVIFREQSPGARIHPRISVRNHRKLRERFSHLVPA